MHGYTGPQTASAAPAETWRALVAAEVSQRAVGATVAMANDLPQRARPLIAIDIDRLPSGVAAERGVHGSA